MISIIQNIVSPDVADFEVFFPEDPLSFSFLLSVLVGPKDTQVEESFDIQICTPKWLLENYNEDDIILGKNKLIVFGYDRAKIFSRVHRLFENITGDNWEAIAIKLSRIGRWEFEDYQAFK